MPSIVVRDGSPVIRAMPGEANTTSAAKGAMIMSMSPWFQPSSQCRWSRSTVESSTTATCLTSASLLGRGRSRHVNYWSPVEFDPFSEEFFNDPTELYRRLRDEAPVWFSEKYGFYALSRFADVLAAHRDWEAFSSAHGIELFTLSMDPEEVKNYRSIIMMDPPEHDRFRAWSAGSSRRGLSPRSNR